MITHRRRCVGHALPRDPATTHRARAGRRPSQRRHALHPPPPREQPAGHVLGRQRERRVVAPGAVDVQVALAGSPPAGSRASPRPAGWRAFSGRMFTSIRCMPSAEEAVVAAIATACGVIPRPATARSTQYPICADAQRAPHDPAHRDLAGEPPVVLDRERQHPPGPRLAARTGAPSRRTSSAGARLLGVGRLPRRQPAAGSPSAREFHAARVAAPQRTQQHAARPAARPARPARSPLTLDTPPPTSVVAAAHLVDRVRQHRRQHRQAVPAAAGRAGQVDDQRAARPAPARPRESDRRRHPGATPYARIASASPGTSRSSTRGSPRACGRSGDSPVPPVVSTTSYAVVHGLRAARCSTGSPSGTTTGPVDVEPQRAQPLDEHRPAAVGVHPGRGPVRGRHDQRAPRGPRAALSLIARQSPDRPPLFATTRTAVISLVRSTALTMSTSARAGDRDAGQRLHLDAGAVRGAHRGARCPPRRRPPSRSTRTPCTATGCASGTSSGVRLARLDARRAGRRRARRPSARPRRAAAATTSAEHEHPPGRGGLAHGDRLGRDVDHPGRRRARRRGSAAALAVRSCAHRRPRSSSQASQRRRPA